MTPRARLPLLAPVALAVLVVAVLLAELGADPRPAPAVLAADLVVGLLACAALPSVHRHPLRGALVVSALSALTPTVTPVAGTAVLFCAERRRLREALLAGGAAIVGQVVRDLWRPAVGLPPGWWFVVVALAFAAVVGWGAWNQARRQLVKARVEHARADERTRIAREMHDTLAHRLSQVAMLAGAMEYHPTAAPEELGRTAGAIRVAAHEALEELRGVIGVLRDPTEGGVEATQPGWSELPALFEQSRLAGDDVEVRDEVAPSDAATMPDGLGRAAYRIVQEALTNARKHAAGHPVLVELRGRPGGELVIEVTNELARSRRSAPPPGSGTGLLGMAERVELLGGRLEHGSTSSREHRLRASLPWRA